MKNKEKKELIFVLYSSYPNYSGGRENWLYNISLLLNRFGYNIKIISYIDPSRKIFYKIDYNSGLKVIQLPISLSIPILGKLLRKIGFSIIDWHLFNMYIFLYSLIKNINNNIFLSLGPIHDSLGLGLAKSLNKKIRFINLIRGLHANVSSAADPMLSKYYYFLEKFTMGKADLIISNGYDTKEYVKSLGFENIAIPNGVNYEKFAEIKYNKPKELQNETKFYIVMVATLSPVKALDDALLALKVLKERNERDLILVFVGKGNIKMWQDKADGLGIGDLVIFTGQKDNVPAYYQNADVALTLNYGKNAGNNNAIGGGVSMSFLEALASGTPVIAFNNQIYNTIVTDHENSLLVEERQPQTLANAILEIRNNPELSKKIGLNAQNLSKNYDWNLIAQRFIKEVEFI